MTRTLTASDIPGAVELSSTPGWNQTAEDWRMLLDLEPEGCFAIDCEGRLAATATLVRYERRLAWLGMVLTAPPFRNRGFARRLVAHALAFADDRGVETVKLDATDQGQPIYEGFGFHAEQPVERWQRAGAPIPDATSSDAIHSNVLRLDCDAYSADRSRMLARLAVGGKTHTSEGGYLLARSGTRAAFAGPCVAATPEAAESLIRRGVPRDSGPWFWDLLPRNTDAVRIARALGFSPVRRLVRMYRGRELRGREDMIYALAGFELG